MAGSNVPINNLQPYLALNFQIALYGIYPSRNGADPFIGEIILTPYNYEVRDHASCNGQLLSVNTNSALFSLLGTVYGGNGMTTFALPDLRGRVPVHMGQGPGLQRYELGQQSGTETTTLLLYNMPAHNHTITTTVNPN
ncbi:tail fiber protein [Flavobacterium panacis]|nr:tail fiber protein [Flavobacterium panacis]